MTGAIATMTNAGLSARFAATHLQNTLLALSSPSSTATKALESVGLSAQQVKDTLSQQGLGGAIDPISTAVGKTFPANSVEAVTAFKDIMGGATGMSTALTLGGKSSKEFADNVKNIGSVLNSGTTQVQGFARSSQDLGAQAQGARAGLDSLAIEIGDAVLPKLEKLAVDAMDVVTWFEKHKAAAEALGIVLGGVAAGALLLWTTGLMSNAAAFLANLAPASRFGAAMTNVSVTLSQVTGRLGSTGTTATTAMSEAATATEPLDEALAATQTQAERTAAAIESIGPAADTAAAQVVASSAEADAALATEETAAGGADVAMAGEGAAAGASAAGLGSGAAAEGLAAAGEGLGLTFASVAGPLLVAGLAAWWGLHQNKLSGTVPLTAPGQGGTAGMTQAEIIAKQTDNIEAQGRAGRPVPSGPVTPAPTAVQKVEDDATKQMANLGAKDHTLGALQANIVAMGQLFGKGSPEQIAALQALRSQVQTWFPQLAKDKSVSSELKDIAAKQLADVAAVNNAKEQITGLQSAIKIVSGGKSLSDLEEDERRLQDQLKDPPKGADIKALHTDLAGVQAKIADVKTDTAQLHQLESIVSTSEKQGQQLQALKDGIDGNFSKLMTDMDHSATTADNGLRDVANAVKAARRTSVSGRIVATVSS